MNYTVGKTGLEERRFPLQTEIPCAVEETVEIASDFGDSAFAAPFDTTVEADGVTYARRMALTNGAFVASSRFAMLKSLYPPAAYQGLRGALQRIETARLAEPVFAGAPRAERAGSTDELLPPEKPGDVLVLAEETTLEPGETPEAWSETVRTRKRILTYAVKIRAGDVKFGYNPAMNHVELLASTVTGPHGAVHAVTDLEKNVMYQPWVALGAALPRRQDAPSSTSPASKSAARFDYTVKRTWARRVLPHFVKRFGGFDDIAEQSLIVKGGADFARPSANATAAPLTVVHTNLPGIVREQNLPPGRYLFEQKVRLVPEITAWDYGATIEATMAACATNAPLASAKARALVAGKASVAEKVRAIAISSRTQIRVAGPAYSDLPSTCSRPPTRTFESGLRTLGRRGDPDAGDARRPRAFLRVSCSSDSGRAASDAGRRSRGMRSLRRDPRGGGRR